jgi:cell division protein FtsL
MRLLHLIVAAGLLSTAIYVYKIKFDSTLQAERIAKLTTDLRRMHDANASLRAEWSQLDNPSRIQGLAARHLKLRPVEAAQFDKLDHLPDRAPPSAAEEPDPIGAIIDMKAPDYPTGSSKKPVAAR